MLNVKAEWKLSVTKLDSIVYAVKSLGKLAVQTGIVPVRSKDEVNPDFDTMPDRFQIDLEGAWRHNGAKDAVYQMALAFMIALYPVLYPGTDSGFLGDPTIASKTVNEIWTNFAARKDTMPTLAVGHVRFYFYCEAAESHDAEDCHPQQAYRDRDNSLRSPQIQLQTYRMGLIEGLL